MFFSAILMIKVKIKSNYNGKYIKLHTIYGRIN